MAQRLQASKKAAAGRGELRTPLPVGYLHDDDDAGEVVIDPDAEVQAAINDVFSCFASCGSAYGVVAAFAGRRFPLRAYGGAWAGQLRWGALTHVRVLGVLKNPCYAGAYVHGRYTSHRRVEPDGTVHTGLVERPRSQWPVLLTEHHEGYLSWADYLANEAKLAANRTNAGARPPREGSALCQGIIFCGSCGKPMRTNYHSDQRPSYECSSRADRLTTPTCRSVVAATVDNAVATTLLEVLTPEQIALALSAADQVADRHQRVSRAAELAVERARYEADRAERAFHACEPENRFGLPVEDAADMAQAIALDRDGAVDEPTPASVGDRPWDSFTDAAGALLPEYTVPRAPSGPTSIDLSMDPKSCVLPGSDELYFDAAATTAEDLAVLAPAVTAETRSAVEQAYPELDELVAAWFDPDAQVAKLQVLGPVTVTAHGRPPAKQLDFCTEIVLYLWQHPNGVSTDQFANDLWPNKNYVGTDSYPKDMASRVRAWLGVDPRTGKEYMPRAGRDGVDGYRLDGVLVSYDLFCRLRARGEARGTDGLPDLITALELVTGSPLSQLRPFGYGWLPAGQEWLYAGAVIEVAHLVATRALEAGDNAEAIRACEVALKLDAEDDRALLSMAKAHENAGRHAERDATIQRLKTLEDPPERTLEVMRRNGWLAKGA